MRAYKRTSVARRTHSMRTDASSSGLPASQILHGVRKETLFNKQLEAVPAFQTLLEFHMLLHESITQQHTLNPVATTVSDAHGVFVR